MIFKSVTWTLFIEPTSLLHVVFYRIWIGVTDKEDESKYEASIKKICHHDVKPLFSDLSTRVTRTTLPWTLLVDSQMTMEEMKIVSISPQKLEPVQICILSMMLPVICRTGLLLSVKKNLAKRVAQCARMVIQKWMAGASDFIIQDRSSLMLEPPVNQTEPSW